MYMFMSLTCLSLLCMYGDADEWLGDGAVERVHPRGDEAGAATTQHLLFQIMVKRLQRWRKKKTKHVWSMYMKTNRPADDLQRSYMFTCYAMYVCMYMHCGCYGQFVEWWYATHVMIARPYMRCKVECTPIKVLQLFCWPHDPPFHSQPFPMTIHSYPVAGNLPIKTLVARQWPTNMHVKYGC